MKKIAAIILAAAIVSSASGVALASDWGVAGKVLTGLEGLRILSGGKVDPVGGMFGVNRNDRENQSRGHGYYQQRNWTPSYVWVKRWVPEHTEYDPSYGEILVEGHYIQYKAENGGYWQHR